MQISWHYSKAEGRQEAHVQADWPEVVNLVDFLRDNPAADTVVAYDDCGPVMMLDREQVKPEFL